MEKISNETFVRIFAAYWGAKVEEENNPKQVQSVNSTLSDYYKQLDMPFHYKLLLKSLSKITDDDKSYCLKIVHQNSRLYGVVNFTYLGRLECNAVDADQWQQIIDYLRSKGYDCGYCEIPSLIDAGIAIEKI